MTTVQELLNVDQIDKDAVRQYFNATEKSVQRDILILKEWLKKQAHLPKNQEDLFLEIILFKNKFRIEQCKVKIDAYYSVRHHFKHFFYNVPIGKGPSHEIIQVLPMPKLTPQNERVTVYRIQNTENNDFDLVRCAQICFIMTEVRIRNDHSIGDRVVMDAKNFTFDHFKKMSPIALRDFLLIYQAAFSGRIVNLHYINFPKFANIILKLLKEIFSPKLFGKIIVHDSLESLYEYVPKENLPDTFGGTGGKAVDLLEKWDKYFKENTTSLEKSLNQVSDESLRIGKLPYTNLIELDGTFKKLDID